jgi:hypothetical protein
MYSIIISAVLSFFSFQLNLVGKTFTYFDKLTGSKESFIFSDSKKLKWIGQTEFAGKYYEDICFGNYTIEGNKIKIVYSCDDKEVYPDPQRETFVFSATTNALISTIHYDQKRSPKVFVAIK